MASPILHIKDAYYFEVPKALWASRRAKIEEFPEVWVRLDPEYQDWEADRLADKIVELVDDAPAKEQLIEEWHHWQHADHANAGAPLSGFLEAEHARLRGEYGKWRKADPVHSDKSFVDFLVATNPEHRWFARRYDERGEFRDAWQDAKLMAGGVDEFAAGHTWSADKITGYNQALSGRILIPQPFGKLRNLYERDSGFCISKFMIIEVAVALVIVFLFSRVAPRLARGEAPKGRLANLLEGFLVILRDTVARPAIGHHDADRYVPLLWTLFMFILGCNLAGMVPWSGTPTGAMSVTAALASITLVAGMIGGMRNFGPLGFFLNQVPHMDLPPVIGPIIKAMVFAIEVLGMMIKHGVLAIRLLANMAAGHLVLLGILGLVFSYEAAHSALADMPVVWGVGAVSAVVGSTLLSCLELFVAFLQAYVFTFLSALFIGAAVHHH